MSSPPVPDPYVALGVPRDATNTQIKATYRKLALRWHPDKVMDESLKAQASDQFHLIQQAYEIIGDEDRRDRYDAQIRLAELRREAMERRADSPRVDVRTAAYEMPTASPGPRAAFRAQGPERVYEERRPSKTYDSYDSDNDYFGDTRDRSRKYHEYEREQKRSSPRVDREREKERDRDTDRERMRGYTRESKESVKAGRSDRRRSSNMERMRERDSKPAYDSRPTYISDDSDESSRYGSTSRRRDDDDRDYYSRRQRDHAAYDHHDGERPRKASYSTLGDNARDYMEKARVKEVRPASVRTSSAREPYMERPAVSRRSSARPSTYETSPKHSSGRERERGERKYSLPDSDSVDARLPRRPAMPGHNSSPAGIRLPRDRSPPPRGQTLPSRYEAAEFTAPVLGRSQTMPVNPQSSSSSRRREGSAPLHPSGLRKTEVREGLITPSTSPDYPSPKPPKYYRVPDNDTDYAPSSDRRRATIREPSDPRDRRMTRSPSPIRPSPRPSAAVRSSSARYGAPPLAPLRTTSSSHSYAPQSESPTSYSPSSYSPSSHSRPSPLLRQASGLPFYDDASSPSTKKIYDYSGNSSRDKERPHRFSPDPDKVQYSHRILPENVKMTSGYSASLGRGGVRPTPRRTLSQAY